MPRQLARRDRHSGARLRLSLMRSRSQPSSSNPNPNLVNHSLTASGHRRRMLSQPQTVISPQSVAVAIARSSHLPQTGTDNLQRCRNHPLSASASCEAYNHPDHRERSMPPLPVVTTPEFTSTTPTATVTMAPATWTLDAGFRPAARQNPRMLSALRPRSRQPREWGASRRARARARRCKAR